MLIRDNILLHFEAQAIIYEFLITSCRTVHHYIIYSALITGVYVIADASYDKEESWKFSYVYKGADKSCQKTLYYVFGKGLKKDHSEFSDESQSRPQGKGYEWPSVYKQHGHLYFDITFLPQGKGLDSIHIPSYLLEVIVLAAHWNVSGALTWVVSEALQILSLYLENDGISPYFKELNSLL